MVSSLLFAVRVFLDPNHVELDATRPADGEFRFKVIGKVDGRLLVVVGTRRGVHRIISARRRKRPMATVRYTLDVGKDHGLRDSGVVSYDALSEAEITAAAKSDPDNPSLTEDELARVAIARRVRKVRTELRLTQERFAVRYGIPVATLRQWELGRRSPDQASLSYLQVIAALPGEVAAVLEPG